MEILFLTAGILAAVTGRAHSLLGERLIFRQLRASGLVPKIAAPPLSERNIRILWATWHIGSVFGWAMAGILLWLGYAPNDRSIRSVIIAAVIAAYLGSSALVLVGTKGKHPGWIALLLVAILTWAASGGG